MGRNGKLLIGTYENDDFIFGTNNIERMRILNSGNVGIGTTSPLTKLSVQGTAGQPVMNIASSTGASLLYVSESGNVGIGTALPDYALDVNGSFRGRQASTFLKGLTINDNGDINGNFIIKGDTDNDLFRTDAGEDAIGIGYTAANLVGTTGKLLVNGNIGIGTTTPKANFVVNGTTNSFFQIASSTNQGIMVVDNNGNVGIGDATPDYRLTVDHNSDGVNVAYVNATNAWTSGLADYAEYYYSIDTDLKSGEAVCVDIERENAVKRCERAADGNIMGIVSTNPAFLGNAPSDERREDNPHYAIIGMLGQVPARVSAEGGAIRPGDSLTSASVPGYIMRAKAGDPTVGVALSSFAKATADEGREFGVINILISRRNKSLTVEEVEDKVTERVAAMEIEDEVNILIAGAIDSLNLEDNINEIVSPQLLLIDAKLTLALDSLSDLALNIRDVIPERFEEIDARMEGMEQLTGGLTLKLEEAGLIKLVEAWDGSSPRDGGLPPVGLVLDTAGRFGIATSSPTNILTIGRGAGSAIADGWDVYLPRADEMEVTYLEEADYAEILGLIAGMEMGRYGGGEVADGSSPRDGGLPPIGMISDGESVSLYDYTSFALAGVKALNHRLMALEKFLTVERDENGDLVEMDSLEDLKADLAKLGLVLDEEGVLVVDKIRAKDIETEQLKVKGSDGGQAGITLYDRVTGLPYCFFVANGAAQTVAGECGAGVEEPVVEPVVEPVAEEDPAVEEEGAAPADEGLPPVVEEEEVPEEVEEVVEPVVEEGAAPADEGLPPVVEEEEEPAVEEEEVEPVIEPVVIEPVVEDVTPPADVVDTSASVDTIPDDAI